MASAAPSHLGQLSSPSTKLFRPSSIAMGETEPSPSPNSGPSPRKGSRCEECGENPWKYRCPGCGLVSCSLPCVQSHKRRTACSGKRRRTDFVPLAQFDDNLLLSDYNLLEETKRAAEAAQRLIAGVGGNFDGNLPRGLLVLSRASYRQRTRLCFLPQGMLKRETNRSRLDQRNRRIYWTIEWRFHSSNVVLIDHDVDEHVSLSSIIEKHLIPSPWNDPLTPYRNVPSDNLKFFIRKNAKVSKSPFRMLNINAPLGLQLKNILIVEFPVIHVFLPSHQCDFEVEKGVGRFHKNEEPPNPVANNVVAEDTVYKEEEIEEGELSPEIHVVDLMDYSSSKPGERLSLHDEEVADMKESDLKRPSMAEKLAIAQETTNSHSEPSQITRLPNDSIMHENGANEPIRQMLKTVDEGPKANLHKYRANVWEEINRRCARGFSDQESFNFEQEVEDAYRNLIGEMNPDDFLCFDGELMDKDELGGRNNATLEFGVVSIDELEEGEIATP